MLASLIPQSCVSCRRRGQAVCGNCENQMKPWQGVRDAEGFAGFWAPFTYEGTCRTAISRAKFANRRATLGWLAGRMTQVIEDCDVDCVTWVPGSWPGWRARGYEPSRLLAETVAANIGAVSDKLLVRRPGASQTGLSRFERLAGPTLEVRANRVPERVLLVDDVSTTGATMTVAASLLNSAGCRSVFGLVGARTPAHFAWS